MKINNHEFTNDHIRYSSCLLNIDKITIPITCAIKLNSYLRELSTTGHKIYFVSDSDYKSVLKPYAFPMDLRISHWFSDDTRQYITVEDTLYMSMTHYDKLNDIDRKIVKIDIGRDNDIIFSEFNDDINHVAICPNGEPIKEHILHIEWDDEQLCVLRVSSIHPFIVLLLSAGIDPSDICITSHSDDNESFSKTLSEIMTNIKSIYVPLFQYNTRISLSSFLKFRSHKYLEMALNNKECNKRFDPTLLYGVVNVNPNIQDVNADVYMDQHTEIAAEFTDKETPNFKFVIDNLIKSQHEYNVAGRKILTLSFVDKFFKLELHPLFKPTKMKHLVWPENNTSKPKFSEIYLRLVKYLPMKSNKNKTTSIVYKEFKGLVHPLLAWILNVCPTSDIVLQFK